LETTEDADILELCIRGFKDCATIAAHYRLSNVFDNLIVCVLNFSNLQ